MFLFFFFFSVFFLSLNSICYNIASVLHFGFFFAVRHVDLSSLTRDRTRTPSIGRQSLNHWTAREVSEYFFKLESEM